MPNTIKMVFKKGEVANPKGNTLDTKRTGPNTELGKLKSIIKRGMIKQGKHLKMKRSCDICPLTPLIIKDKEVMRCPHYEKGSPCRLILGDWKAKLEAHWKAEELGDKELLRLYAADAYAYSLMNADTESIKRGAPAHLTHDFLKTAREITTDVAKLSIEKQKVDSGIPEGGSNHVHFDITGLIRQQQDEDMKRAKTVDVSSSSKEPEETSSEEDSLPNTGEAGS